MDPRPEAINLSGMGESVRGQDSPDGVSDAVPPDLPALARQVRVLEHRVHALEERLEGTPRFFQASSRQTHSCSTVKRRHGQSRSRLG